MIPKGPSQQEILAISICPALRSPCADTGATLPLPGLGNVSQLLFLPSVDSNDSLYGETQVSG